MKLKDKRERTIKARGCVGARPQREYINKEDTSAPNVPYEAMMPVKLIQKKEGMSQ